MLCYKREGKGDALFQVFHNLSSKVPYIVFTDADYIYTAQFVTAVIEILKHNPAVGMVIDNRFKGQFNTSKSFTHPFYVGNPILTFTQLVMNGVKLE